MPAGGSSYLATMGSRSFSYQRLKKLPPAAATAAPSPPGADPASTAAVAIEESYRSYYRALVARGRSSRRRSSAAGRPRPRRRLRAWGALARALRRRAAAAGARVRASVSKVARRLREGRPYVGDLFAGNYMFLQVSAVGGGGGGGGRAVVPFADYYYGCKAREAVRSAAGAGALQLQHHPAVAATTRCSSSPSSHCLHA